MCSLPAFYGIRVHFIIARLLRGDSVRGDGGTNLKYQICEEDVKKISLKLFQFTEEMQLHNPRIEFKLSAYNIHGRCDAIFTDASNNCDIIVDWKYNQKIYPLHTVPQTKETTIIQLNIYRVLYMEMFNKDCDIAVVYVNYSKKYGNFQFKLQRVEKYDTCHVWGLINVARQKA